MICGPSMRIGKWKVSMNKHASTTGVVTAQKCPCCGHHEVGYITPDGLFHPLKPGDNVTVLTKPPDAGMPDAGVVPQEREPAGGRGVLAEMAVWVPPPLRTNRLLRRKYGVFIDSDLTGEAMHAGRYEMAYRQKLHRLVETGSDTPLPVVLDRYFVAPHLATGNPEQIAERLWEELDEIRQPVAAVRQWLETRDEAHLAKLVSPFSLDDLAGDAAGDDQLRKELDRLSLENFFEML